MEKLEAGILGTVFRNEENGWTVLTVRAGRNEVTVVGTLPELSPGDQAVFTGEWTEHRSYGRQFRCVSCEIQTPTTLLGIERYLGSGLIRGIGPAKAKALLQELKTIKAVKEASIDELAAVPGVSLSDAEEVYRYFHAEEKKDSEPQVRNKNPEDIT